MPTRIVVVTVLAATAAGGFASAGAQTVTELQLAPASIQAEVGAREGVLVTAYDASGNVVPSVDFAWVSEDAGIARVEPDPATPNIAYIVGVSLGTTRVTVTVGTTQAIISVVVLGASGPSGVGEAFSLEIFPNPIQLLPTEEVVLESRFLRVDGQLAARAPITWSSLRDEVAAVDQRGTVIGISVGQGVIQATSPNGMVARVVVQVANESFAFERSRLSLSPAGAETITVVVPGQGGRRVGGSLLRWGSTDGAVASVSQDGVVTGIAAGTAEVVAQGFGQQLRLPVTVHRPVTVMEIAPQLGSVVIPLTGSVPFEVTFFDASDSPVPEARPSWTVADTSIVTFDASTGTATGQSMGTTRLTMRGPSGLEANWDLEVVGGAISLGQPRLGLSVGDTVTVPASYVDANGTVLAQATGLTWTSQSAAVATTAGNGAVVGTGWGRTQVVASASWGAADTVDVFVQGEILVTKFPGGGGDIYAFDPGNPTAMNQISSGPTAEIGASYSPDGSRIVYVASGADGVQKVFLMDADGSNPRVLNDSPQREGSPEFTPDGTRIVFESNQDIWIMNVDGSSRVQLTSGEVAEDRPTVSPDGMTIAYQSTEGNNSDVFVMSVDGTQQRPLIATDDHETFPGWFPDGSLGYVSIQRSGRDRTRLVMRTDLSTGEAVALSPAELRAVNFAVSSDGNTLALVFEVREDRNLIRKLFVLPLSGPGAGTPVEVPRTDPTEQFFFPAFRR